MVKLYVYCDGVELEKTFDSFVLALDSYYQYLSLCKKHQTDYLIYLADMNTEEIIKISDAIMEW